MDSKLNSFALLFSLATGLMIFMGPKNFEFLCVTFLFCVFLTSIYSFQSLCLYADSKIYKNSLIISLLWLLNSCLQFLSLTQMIRS